MTTSLATTWDCLRMRKGRFERRNCFSALRRKSRSTLFRARLPARLRRNATCRGPGAPQTSSRPNRRSGEACGEFSESRVSERRLRDFSACLFVSLLRRTSLSRPGSPRRRNPESSGAPRPPWDSRRAIRPGATRRPEPRDARVPLAEHLRRIVFVFVSLFVATAEQTRSHKRKCAPWTSK